VQEDDDLADDEDTALPGALVEALHTPDDEVGPQAPAVPAERRDRPVRGDEQGQHVEALRAVAAHEAGLGPRGIPHRVSDRRVPPRPPVDAHDAGGRVEGGAQAEQARARAR